ncbi:hypothetical protein LIER_17454 [Lithospermum erythrorhizon]|uniref:Uncharacterized protein n=1 Tax=Lithospermum erythrorhizon TaxID=34254 RepID=A0AAV3QEH6_LITER
MHWLEEGDFCNSFFSRSVLAYKSRMKISMLEDDHGHTISDPDELERIVVDFYKDLFKSKGGLDGKKEEYIKSLIHRRVPLEHMKKVNAQPTIAEVHEAVFLQGYGKSPGLDGLGIEFYKFNWQLIKEDLFETISYIFAT